MRPIPDEVLTRVAELADQHRGVLLRQELLAAGVSPAQLKTAVRQGRWVRVGTGLYAVEPTSHPAARAAQAVAGQLRRLDPDGRQPERWVASGRTAAIIHGVPVLGRRGAVQLVDRLGPPGHRLGAAALRLDDCEVILGVPVTDLPRTAVDVARVAGWIAGLVTADAALRVGVSREAMLSVLERAPRVPGNVAARRAVELARAKSESPLESFGRGQLLDQGIEEPDLQVDLGDEDGFIGRVDHLWRSRRVVGEADGRGKLKTKADLDAEKDREDRLREAGFEVVRYTWSQIWSDPAKVAGRVRRAFARAEARRAA